MSAMSHHQVLRRIGRCTALALIAAGAATGAGAQPHDHLQCFKLKDAASYSGIVDLRPLHEPPFAVEAGCRLKIRSRELCIPVKKTLGDADAPSLDVAGQDLQNAFLCYAVKCPDLSMPPSLTMSDQFGTRTLSGFRTSKMCAPAVFGAPAATTTTTQPAGTPRSCVDAVPPACDGTCGDQNFACVPDNGACICDGVDVFFPCGLIEGPPDCLGSCDGQHSCVHEMGSCQCALVLE
ncbi:MAG TPA: hypothetical protein VEC57_17645 [Candidatus Limnocylindrales bacterium]|nr:hypothetical protein [Candidatus Limnocylindrales bacterium]